MASGHFSWAALARAGGPRSEGRELQMASLKIARSLGKPGLTARILASLSGSIVMLDDSPAAASEALELVEEAALEPLDRKLRDEDCHRLSSLLGEERFASYLGKGRSLKSADQVLSYLLTEPGPGSPGRPASPGLAQLSARERQLVTLVAQGRTDAQIAGQLYISVRTVHSHLDRIRDKTGCRRRADLTRLALAAGLI
jgi:DNA-binding CsgD family transcriptional regulator